MSRVERTENHPTDRRDAAPQRQAGRGTAAGSPRKDPTPGPTPSKAEGELRDVEEALEHQSE